MLCANESPYKQQWRRIYIGSETANPCRALNIEQALDVKD